MKIVDYYTQKTVKMSFLSLLSFPRKRESRGKNWIPFQARNDRREYLYSNRKGITLIELVIGMVLMGIVALVVANALSTGITGFFTIDYRKESLDQARLAMERMAREIRNLRNNTSVTTSSATQFCFYDVNNTLINFSLQGADIKREEAGDCNAGGPNETTLATTITATAPSLFQYFRPDGVTSDATFSPENTRLIRITLTSTTSGEAVQLQTEVWPRNLALIPPDPPTGLTGSLSGNCGINLSWTAPSPAPASYRIYRCATAVGSPSTPSCFSMIAQGVIPTSYSDSVPTPNRDYHYKVTSVSGAGVESTTFSNEFIQTYAGMAAPTGLQITELTCTTTLSTSWTAYAGAASYKIYRNVYAEGAAAGAYDPYQSGVVPTNSSDTSLTSRQNHSYKVSAMVGSCETNQSTAVTADVDPIWYVAATGTWANTTPYNKYRFDVQQNSGQTLTLNGITVTWPTDGNPLVNTVNRIRIPAATTRAASPPTWGSGVQIPFNVSNYNLADATNRTAEIRWTNDWIGRPSTITVQWRYNVTLPSPITNAQGCQIQVYP